MNKYQLIASMIPAGSCVVDVGCGRGHLGRALARHCCQLIGVDRSDPARRLIRGAAGAYAELLTLDIEDERTWEHPLLRRADVFVFSDVLEHLVDPHAVLRWARELLHPAGRTIVSLPNVAHWSVRLMLLMGRWRYTDDGILDRTHLRFYTRRSAEALLVQAGYRVARREVPTFTPEWVPEALAAASGRVARVALPELLAEGFVWQLEPRVKAWPEQAPSSPASPSSRATRPAL